MLRIFVRATHHHKHNNYYRFWLKEYLAQHNSFFTQFSGARFGAKFYLQNFNFQCNFELVFEIKSMRCVVHCSNFLMHYILYYPSWKRNYTYHKMLKWVCRFAEIPYIISICYYHQCEIVLHHHCLSWEVLIKLCHM